MGRTGCTGTPKSNSISEATLCVLTRYTAEYDGGGCVRAREGGSLDGDVTVFCEGHLEPGSEGREGLAFDQRRPIYSWFASSGRMLNLSVVLLNRPS